MSNFIKNTQDQIEKQIYSDAIKSVIPDSIEKHIPPEYIDAYAGKLAGVQPSQTTGGVQGVTNQFLPGQQQAQPSSQGGLLQNLQNQFLGAGQPQAQPPSQGGLAQNLQNQFLGQPQTQQMPSQQGQFLGQQGSQQTTSQQSQGMFDKVTGLFK